MVAADAATTLLPVEGNQPPQTGTIVIAWRRFQAEDGSTEFDWDVQMEPPGLDDESISQLLAEIAERF